LKTFASSLDQQRYLGLIDNLTEEEARKLYHSLLMFHWIDDSISEADFICHLKGNDTGYVPEHKIHWLNELKGLVILMDVFGVNQWKLVSQRFQYDKYDIETTFYKSLKRVRNNLIEEKKNNRPVGKTDTLALAVVRIINRACGSADNVISKNDTFYDPYI